MSRFILILAACFAFLDGNIAGGQDQAEQPAPPPFRGGFRPPEPLKLDEPFFIKPPDYGTSEWAIENAESWLRYQKQYYPPKEEIRDQYEFVKHFLDRDVTAIRLRDTPFHFSSPGSYEAHRQVIREVQEQFKKESRAEIDFPAAVEKLESVFSPAERSALWFSEIGLQGPYRYLVREDVRKELEITNDQLMELENVRKRLVTEVPRDVRELRRKAILKIFDDLSGDQRRQFESLVGYRIATLAQYFDEVPRERIYLILEMKLPVNLWVTQGRGDKPLQIIYTGRWIDPVLEPLIRTIGADQPLRPHDDEQAERFAKLFAEGKKLELMEPVMVLGNLSEYWKVHFERALALVGPETADLQSIDSSAGIDRSARNVGKEFKTFTDSVVAEMIVPQLITCRDEVLCRIGPVRFLLTPCIAEQIGLTEEDRERIKDESVQIHRQLQWDERDVYSRAFSDIFAVLTVSQRKQIESRIGFTTKEMAHMYPGQIIHKSKYKEQAWEGINQERFVQEMLVRE